MDALVAEGLCKIERSLTSARADEMRLLVEGVSRDLQDRISRASAIVNGQVDSADDCEPTIMDQASIDSLFD